MMQTLIRLAAELATTAVHAVRAFNSHPANHGSLVVQRTPWVETNAVLIPPGGAQPVVINIEVNFSR
jgi:hypothetical protein